MFAATAVLFVIIVVGESLGGVAVHAQTVSYVGVLYDSPKFAEVVPGAGWAAVILSDPLDGSYASEYKTFVANMHSNGVVAAGTLYRPTMSQVTSAALKTASFGFDMIILDELISPGIADAKNFNKLYAQVKAKYPKVQLGLSDYDEIKMQAILSKGARPDFIALTCYQALATSQYKIDVLASLSAKYKVPAYAWINIADPAYPQTTDQELMKTVAVYAKSKLNGVWFWEYGDITWSGWTWGDWYLKNYPYVKLLVSTL